MTTKRCFWIVWSPSGPTNPRVRHDSREEAERVAREMAVRHPGSRFFACRADYSAHLPIGVTEERLVTGEDGFYDPDLPF